MNDQAPRTTQPSEREKVAREQKQHATRQLRDDARQNGAAEQLEHRSAAGRWPGEELTRNVVPNADDDPEREALPDDIQRDISRDGVTHDPAQGEPLR